MIDIETQQEFAQRWQALAEELHIPAHVASTALLVMDRYDEPSRHYHTKKHVLSMLREADKLTFDDPQAAKLAIFFHDVIYDTRRKDNEEQSAQVMEALLREVVPQERLDKAMFSIRATQPHVRTDVRDTDLVIDLDMAILGQPWAVYERYAMGIYKEYGGDQHPEKYREGRIGFLTNELKKTENFITPEFKHLEAPARRNLERERDVHQQGKALGGRGIT